MTSTDAVYITCASVRRLEEPKNPPTPRADGERCVDSATAQWRPGVRHHGLRNEGGETKPVLSRSGSVSRTAASVRSHTVHVFTRLLRHH